MQVSTALLGNSLTRLSDFLEAEHLRLKAIGLTDLCENLEREFYDLAELGDNLRNSSIEFVDI